MSENNPAVQPKYVYFNERWTGVGEWAGGWWGECIYGNGVVPSCHSEEDGCHKQGDHLTSAAPQLRGVKMLLKTLYRSSLNM